MQDFEDIEDKPIEQPLWTHKDKNPIKYNSNKPWKNKLGISNPKESMDDLIVDITNIKSVSEGYITIISF